MSSSDCAAFAHVLVVLEEHAAALEQLRQVVPPFEARIALKLQGKRLTPELV